MPGLTDRQWIVLEQYLKKIDNIDVRTQDAEKGIQGLVDAIHGNGSIGMKDQLNQIREDLKSKVNIKDCENNHKTIEKKEEKEDKKIDRRVADKREKLRMWLTLFGVFLTSMTGVIIAVISLGGGS